MTPEERRAARERCEKATPGPWWNAADFFRTKYGKRITPKNPGWFARTWRALPGMRLRDSWAMLFVAPSKSGASPAFPIQGEFDRGKHRFDEWDFAHVVGLQWRSVRGDAWCPSALGDEDADFIAHARADLPAALHEIERLEREIARLKAGAT